MTDTVDPATRSRMMARIKRRDTKPELLVRSMLHRRGFRFRLDRRDLPGRPDIVLQGYRAAVFVHGCFWHGHDCPLFRLPGTHTEFWRGKIDRNRERDRQAAVALLAQGWRVATVWECALRGVEEGAINLAMDTVATWLRSDSRVMEVRG